MMVEVLSGVLAGSAIGPDIRRWKGDDRIANLVCNYYGEGQHKHILNTLVL